MKIVISMIQVTWKPFMFVDSSYLVSIHDCRFKFLGNHMFCRFMLLGNHLCFYPILSIFAEVITG